MIGINNFFYYLLFFSNSSILYPHTQLKHKQVEMAGGILIIEIVSDVWGGSAPRSTFGFDCEALLQ